MPYIKLRRRGGGPPPLLVHVLHVLLVLHDAACTLLSTPIHLRGALKRAFASNVSSSLFSIISTIAVSRHVWVGFYGCHDHVHSHRASCPLRCHSPCRVLLGARALLSTSLKLPGTLEHAFASNTSSSSFPIISTIAVSLCLRVWVVVTFIVIARHINCKVIPPAIPVHQYTLSVFVRQSMTAQSHVIRPYPKRWQA